jgi:hypothetical protein
MDFYLLPTFEEVTDPNNTPSLFPKYQALSDAAEDFHRAFCTVGSIASGLTFSKFNRPFTGTLDTDKLMKCITSLSSNSLDPLIHCFNAFDKGPLRTIMFLQMLNDIRDGRLVPQKLISPHFGLIYDKLRGFYHACMHAEGDSALCPAVFRKYLLAPNRHMGYDFHEMATGDSSNSRAKTAKSFRKFKQSRQSRKAFVDLCTGKEGSLISL